MKSHEVCSLKLWIKVSLQLVPSITAVKNDTSIGYCFILCITNYKFCFFVPFKSGPFPLYFTKSICFVQESKKLQLPVSICDVFFYSFMVHEKCINNDDYKKKENK